MVIVNVPSGFKFIFIKLKVIYKIKKYIILQICNIIERVKKQPSIGITLLLTSAKILERVTISLLVHYPTERHLDGRENPTHYIPFVPSS